MSTPTRLVGREIRLAARPVGRAAPRWASSSKPRAELVDGQVLVTQLLDGRRPVHARPHGRRRASYIAPFALGEAASSALGTPGLTAYAALTEIAPVREGDTVLVSSAAGAVGSVAGQVARRLGAARVIGIAGGPRKIAAVVDDFGFDAAIDHRAGPIAGQLPAVAPDGIDVYVDHVGGEHLEAAIGALHVGGRVALVGAVSGYNATEPAPGPRNLYDAVKKRLTLRGMLVTDHLDLFPTWVPLAAGMLADGSLRTSETVVMGLEAAPDALVGVLRGANTGKMLVRLT